MRTEDRTLDQAIDAEERDLLRRIGEEPGFFAQTFAVFGGKTGWVNLILMAAQTAMFVAGAWAAWRFFEAAEVLEALRWGLPAAVLLLGALAVKLALWPSIHAARQLQDMKRLELLILQRR